MKPLPRIPTRLIGPFMAALDERLAAGEFPTAAITLDGQTHDLQGTPELHDWGRRWLEVRQTAEFLACFGGPGKIEIRTLADSKRAQRFFVDPLKAATHALEASDRADVYFGIGRRLANRGDAASTPFLSAASLDWDPVAGVDVAAFLDRVSDYKPSLVVSSGRGVHAYWLLSEPEPSELVSRLNVAIAAELAGDPKRDTSSAAILRVVGTVNHRWSAVVRLVAGDPANPRRHTLDDLAELFRVELEQTEPAPASTTDRPGQSRLLARVAELGEEVRPFRSGVRLRCLFPAKHAQGDRRPSAVVFSNGWYHCACVSAPAAQWTRRAGVPADLAGLVVQRTTTASSHALIVRAPRVAAMDVAPALGWNAKMAALSMRAGDLTLFDASGRRAVFMDADDIAQHMAAISAWPQAWPYRCFWACIAEAQIANRRNPAADGRFVLSAARLAELLGRNGGADRQAIRRATEALERIELTIQWSGRTKPVRGRIIARIAETLGTGQRLYHLHPAIWGQMRGNSPAWFAWHVGALQLRPEAMAVYLTGQRLLKQRGKTGLPLLELLTHAGVPFNRVEASAHPKRFLDQWRGYFAGLPDEAGLHIGDGSEVLVAPPGRVLPPRFPSL